MVIKSDEELFFSMLHSYIENRDSIGIDVYIYTYTYVYKLR